MMYVICFYWQGDRWQDANYKPVEGHVNKQQAFLDRTNAVSDDLAAKYVNNLYLGVKRFAEQSFQFICFTNLALNVLPDIKLRPFKKVSYSGVLPRLFMFSEEAGLFGHQVLCLDLDVVITGSLKDIMGYRGKFCTRSKFKPGEEYKLDGDIMSFAACKETEDMFWKPFIADIEAAEKLTQGRERYWIRHVIGGEDKADRWNRLYPGSVKSYKRHITKIRHIPKGTSIISCHGLPRPHEIKDNWIKKYWK